MSCMYAEKLALAKDVAGMYAFLRQGMHIKTLAMDVILRMDKKGLWPPCVTLHSALKRLQQEASTVQPQERRTSAP